MRVAFNLKLELYIMAFALQYWRRWKAERKESVDVEWSHIDNTALLCLGRGGIKDPPLALVGLSCFLATLKLHCNGVEPAVIWLCPSFSQTAPSSAASPWRTTNAPLQMQQKHRLAGTCETQVNWSGTSGGCPFALTPSHIISAPRLTNKETTSRQLQNWETHKKLGICSSEWT